MKRFKIIILVALGFVLILLLLARLSGPDSYAPRFVWGAPQSVGPYLSAQYNWNQAMPFVDGKVWVFTATTRTNFHYYFHDLEHQKILGELLNGDPVFWNSDQTKLLCEGWGSPSASLKSGVAKLLAKISFGKIKLNTNNVETFFILDLRNNTARRVGEFTQVAGQGSSWHPSPTFRHGYNVPSSAKDGEEFFLCDLETGAFNKIKLKGDLEGWWGDEEIFVKDPASNFVLYNVTSGKTRTLVSAETMAKFFRDAGVDMKPRTVNAFRVWNGREFDFYLRREHSMTLFAEPSFLVKVERNGPALKLVDSAFEYHWLAHLDGTGTQYLYDGESGAPGNGGNGGIYLRDLTNHTTRTLVEPVGPKAGYAIGRFYRDSVIYYHNRQIWRVDLNGSNNVPAFPLPGK
jgi:hypothetical protein